MVTKKVLIDFVDDEFGLCPECHEDPPMVHIGSVCWMVCFKCKTCWRLTSYSDSDWEYFQQKIEGCREVKPYYLSNDPGFVSPSDEESYRELLRRGIEEGQAYPNLKCEGKVYDRFRYGSQVADEWDCCLYCGAPSGKFHGPWCTCERCPRCGTMFKGESARIVCQCRDIVLSNVEDSERDEDG